MKYLNKDLQRKVNKSSLTNIAKDLAKKTCPNTFITLDGPLGAGKTFFATNFVNELSSCKVSSPTYTIINQYFAENFKIFHIDAYRLQSKQDLESVGFFDLLEGSNVILLEWSENIKKFLPERRIEIKLDYYKDIRDISLKYCGYGD